MKTILPCLALGLTLVASPAFAQADALGGTWSGHWIPESGYDAVTVRFVLNDDAITGEMLNQAPVEFDSIMFDPDSLSLVTEAESADHGHVLIEARIEDVTRLNGTLIHRDRTGAVRLTKWTFSPSQRR